MGAGGGNLFIVDNSVSGWTGLEYLRQWSDLARSFDIATGFSDIGALVGSSSFARAGLTSNVELNIQLCITTHTDPDRRNRCVRPGQSTGLGLRGFWLDGPLLLAWLSHEESQGPQVQPPPLPTATPQAPLRLTGHVSIEYPLLALDDIEHC